jgi:hypothetical protein
MRSTTPDANGRTVVSEHLLVLQRALAASEVPGLSEAARGGKVIYLVESPVTEADVAIQDLLIAAELAGGGRPQVLRALREQREALRPFVGKPLLRSGVWSSGKRYELYIDPAAASVVHVTCGDHPDPGAAGDRFAAVDPPGQEP